MRQTLKELHLLTVRECYQEQAEMARRESLSHEHYLSEVIERGLRLASILKRLSKVSP